MPVDRSKMDAFRKGFNKALGDDEEGSGKAASQLAPNATPSAAADLGVDQSDEEDQKKKKY